MFGLLAVLSVSAKEFAYTYEGNTLYYTVLDEEAKTVSVSGFRTLKENLVVPENVSDGTDIYTVSEINSDVFRGEKLNSVTLPQTLIRIGKNAFDPYSGTAYVDFASIESLCSIEFENDYSNPLCYANELRIGGKIIKDLTIPESVFSIGNYTFIGCKSLESVTIPTTVKSIGLRAFSRCSSLTSVIIPESIISIKDETFLGCSSLSYISLPKSITSIGSSAFKDCSSMVSITIPESVKSIEREAFSGCTSLTSIALPDSLTEIKWGTFFNCEALSSVTIPESVANIQGLAFGGCSSLQSVIIPKSVSIINADTFANCINLREVTLHEGISSIESRAFGSCNLVLLTLPKSLSKIGDYAFSGCENLLMVYIPGSVTSIGLGAFRNCDRLEAVYLDSEDPIACSREHVYDHYVDTFSENSFNSGTLYLYPYAIKKAEQTYPWKEFKNVEVFDFMKDRPNIFTYENMGKRVVYRIIDDGAVEASAALDLSGDLIIPCQVTNGDKDFSVVSIGEKAFENSSFTSVSIPDGVVSIGNSAFQGSKITSVSIPEGVVCIGSRAFLDSKITSVSIPKSVVSVGNSAFVYTPLESVSISEGVLNIGEAAFASTKLTSLTIPASISSIEKYAFDRCPLTSVSYLSDYLLTAPVEIFSNDIYRKATLNLTEKGYTTVSQIDPWKNFQNIRIIDNQDSEVEETGEDDLLATSCEVFNIQGRKVGDSTENLSKGIYLVRRGNSVTKIAVD